MRTTSHGTLTLHAPTGARKYLTEDERNRFLAAAARSGRADVHALCATLAWTGCRISEALSLTWDAIDASEGFVAIRCLKKRSKTPVIREVPVPTAVICTIRSLSVRVTAFDQRVWSWSRSRAWQLVKQTMRDAGIAEGPHATPKGLRHSYGLHAVRSGVPLNFVQRWLGHASMTTTAIYLQAMGREERAIAQRMWGTESDNPSQPRG